MARRVTIKVIRGHQGCTLAWGMAEWAIGWSCCNEAKKGRRGAKAAYPPLPEQPSQPWRRLEGTGQVSGIPPTNQRRTARKVCPPSNRPHRIAAQSCQCADLTSHPRHPRPPSRPPASAGCCLCPEISHDAAEPRDLDLAPLTLPASSATLASGGEGNCSLVLPELILLHLLGSFSY